MLSLAFIERSIQIIGTQILLVACILVWDIHFNLLICSLIAFASMTDIFVNKYLYPHGNVMDFFRDYYSSVFIAFLPFFKVKSDNEINTNFSKFTIKSSKSPVIESIIDYDNEYYPTDAEIFEEGQVVNWSAIIKGAAFKDETEILKALQTSVGMYRPEFARPDLTGKLEEYTRECRIWHPMKGEFDIFSKKSILRMLRMLGKKEIVIADEFFDESRTINIHKMNEGEFINSIGNQDVYLFSSDKKILFSINWDRFFFFIASNNSILAKILQEELFEGFLCDTQTMESWEFANA